MKSTFTDGKVVDRRLGRSFKKPNLTKQPQVTIILTSVEMPEMIKKIEMLERLDKLAGLMVIEEMPVKLAML